VVEKQERACLCWPRRLVTVLFALCDVQNALHLSLPAVAVWNSLPRTLLASPSLTVFKSTLKTLSHGSVAASQ